MPRLQFDFNADKLGQALAFLAAHVVDLTKLKAAKLLYFADKQHLLRYGRPITGDRYYCLDHGPNAINDLLAPVRVRIGGKTLENHMSKVLGQYVHVDRKGHQPRLTARAADDELDALTATEREVLEAIVRTYGKFTAWRLIELTHHENTWVTSNEGRVPGSSAEIPWELFLEGADSKPSESIAEHIAEQQENDAFLRVLAREAQSIRSSRSIDVPRT